MFYPDDEDEAQPAKGVWGGCTERERRRIIRQRRRSA